MKILQINTTLNTTSTGRITEEIGKTVMDHGHESYAACNRIGPNGSRSEMILVGNTLDVYAHGLKTRLFDRHGFGSTGATSRLIRQIEDINPDVIGLHNLHGYYLNVEILFNYLKKVQKPVVWTFHDCWPFTGHCAYFDSVNCDKWKTECGSCPLTHAYPASWLMDNSTRNFRDKKRIFTGLENLTIVTPSRWLKNLVDESFLSDYETKVIHNGIDLNTFKPCKTAFSDRISESNKKIILGVASIWDQRKGLNDFVKLSKLLDDQFKIVIVGLSEKQFETIPPNILGIKRTENIEELASLYSSASIFINPTYSDNFPTTNIEALACGTPVITYNTGGSPEAIDSKTGSVVEKGDIELLKDAVEKISVKKSNMKEDCIKRASLLFSKDDRFMDYLKLYESVSAA